MQQLRRVLGTSEPTDRGNGYISGSDASFVLKVGLNSIAKIQRLNPDENVFDVEAAGAPGYMRTLSFAAYEGSSWRILTQRFQMNFEGRIVRPGNLPSDFLDLRVPSSHAPFQLREMLGKPRRQMNISVQAGAGSLVPLPLDATVVLGSPRKARTLPLDIHGNIKPGSLDNRSYQVLCGRRSSSKLSGSYRRSLLQLPDADRSFLRRLAADLVAKAEVKSDQEIAESISNYFQREFQYTLEPVQRLGGDGRSAIRVFLEDRHPAHCEYFATASVLLLRSLSIPARLSTGYLVYEYNDEVDLYQATNENAHAWAEYFDESLGQWRMLESTPGIPEYVAKFGSAGVGDRASNLRSELDSGWLNWTSLALNTLVDLFDQGRRLLRILFTSRFAWLLPLGLLVLLFWIRVSNARHIQQSRRYEAPLSELTRKADHLAGQWGYRRAVHETCIQFALRLRETQCSELQPLADWYDAFAAVRYLPSNSDDIDNRQLIPDLPHIRRPDRSRDRLAATN